MNLAFVDYVACFDRGWLHRAHPLAKAFLTACLVASAVSAVRLWGALVPVAAGLGLMASARLPLRLLKLVLYPAFVAVLFALGWSIAGAALVFLRVVAAALAVVLLLASTPFPCLLGLLGRVLPPLLVDALFLTYRGLFQLLGRLEDLWRAMSLRGGRGRLWARPRALVAALGVAVLCSFSASESWVRAMALRGYRPGSLGRAALAGAALGWGGAGGGVLPTALAALAGPAVVALSWWLGRGAWG
ncbi:MAG: CbiQ family ECF transporter T component [Acetobacteraceae bacterium]|nr:CbiQ family ECF transporter T component [Acetobacteraceae bacterium]